MESSGFYTEKKREKVQLNLQLENYQTGEFEQEP